MIILKMLTGDKNIDMIILNKLDDHDLVMVCQTSKYIDKLCKDQMFWLNRILHKFPYLSMDILNKYKKDRSWSEYYINDLRKINKDDANHYLIGGSNNGRLDHIIIAMKMGANVHAWDDWALKIAIENGNLDIVRYLVEAGANIHTDNDYAIRSASMDGYIDIVKYLVEKGANIHADNDYAIRAARQRRHMDVVNYLKSLP